MTGLSIATYQRLVRGAMANPGFLALVIAVVLYGTWAILADAAVHGWDDLKLIPF